MHRADNTRDYREASVYRGDSPPRRRFDRSRSRDRFQSRERSPSNISPRRNQFSPNRPMFHRSQPRDRSPTNVCRTRNLGSPPRRSFHRSPSRDRPPRNIYYSRGMDLWHLDKQQRADLQTLEEKLDAQVEATHKLEVKCQKIGQTLEKEQSDNKILRSKNTELRLLNEQQSAEIQSLKEALSAQVEATKIMEDKYRKSEDRTLRLHCKLVQEKWERQDETQNLNQEKEDLLASCKSLEENLHTKTESESRLQNELNAAMRHLNKLLLEAEDFHKGKAETCSTLQDAQDHNKQRNDVQDSTNTGSKQPNRKAVKRQMVMENQKANSIVLTNERSLKVDPQEAQGPTSGEVRLESQLLESEPTHQPYLLHFQKDFSEISEGLADALAPLDDFNDSKPQIDQSSVTTSNSPTRKRKRSDCQSESDSSASQIHGENSLNITKDFEEPPAKCSKTDSEETETTKWFLNPITFE
nr:lamin-L(III)-like [Nothobranchius furzeri]XP_054590266.1 lamin-L(III)-like [Nothobranchius furzeri]